MKCSSFHRERESKSTPKKFYNNLSHFSLFLVPGAGFEPTTFGLRVDCLTSVQTGHNLKNYNRRIFYTISFSQKKTDVVFTTLHFFVTCKWAQYGSPKLH
jgi:hypothetical protein